MTELERQYRAAWSQLLAALIRALGDFDLAEDALQEAFAAAAARWPADAPRNARGWLYAVARHKGLDRLRLRRREDLDAGPGAELPAAPPRGPEEVPDERLALLFTCCHPALAAEAQVALTLRTVCGLTSAEIARAFLVPEATLAQRLVRAKIKIREARIPYAVPGRADLPGRLATVMAVIYLVFNEGYAAASGRALCRVELCEEAIGLARVLRALLPPPEAELDGLLALMLLTHARRAARLGAGDELIPLGEQDRALWDRAQLEEGRRLVDGALRAGPVGPYALEAAIAAVHADAARAEETDWRQIALLYAKLLARHPSPVVALNHAVAVSMVDGPAAAWEQLESLRGRLATYGPWHAARADLLRRLGHEEEAAQAYAQAARLAGNDAQRRFLEQRQQRCRAPSP